MIRVSIAGAKYKNCLRLSKQIFLCETSVAPMTIMPAWVNAGLRWVGYRSYFRLRQLNYERQLVERTNETAGGTIRSYELIERHTDDQMLAAIDSFCGPRAVIYDIGANIGIYTAALASDSPQRQIIAVEPAPQNVAYLRRTVTLNNISNQVKIHQCGLGEVHEEQIFYISTYPELSGFNAESATRWEATVAETVTVEQQSLDTLVETTPQPDVLKIDAEGSGPSIIAGAENTLTTHQPALFVEPHSEGFANDTVPILRNKIQKFGYQIEENKEYWKCLPSE